MVGNDGNKNNNTVVNLNIEGGYVEEKKKK